MDNKALRTSYTRKKFVILVKPEGIEMYVSEEGYEPTLLISKARRFDRQEQAQKFLDTLEEQGITGKILPIAFHIELV